MTFLVKAIQLKSTPITTSFGTYSENRAKFYGRPRLRKFDFLSGSEKNSIPETRDIQKERKFLEVTKPKLNYFTVEKKL